jgi:hypothetical protein
MKILFTLKHSILIWWTFLLLASLTFFVWEKHDWFPVTGDEPHYLIMADGITNNFTFEQTLPYIKECQTRAIYPPGLTNNDVLFHCVNGPNGLYNAHNIGLPLIIAAPYKLGGIVGAKIHMIMLCSFIILIAHAVSRYFTDDPRNRILSVVAPTIAVPFIPASSQIYPDVVAGLISITAICWMLKKSECLGTFRKTDFIIAIVVSFLPWLQIKFIVVAFVLTVGLTIQDYLYGRSIFKSARFLLILCSSAIFLAAYNLYAFGKFSGPYKDGALVFSKHALMVLIGLHFDRFQGIFIQNPSYFLGLLFLAPFMKRYVLAGSTIILAYFSQVLPNALHPNWYGGGSFAGRFVWSAAITFLPVVIFGLSSFLKDMPRKGIWVVFTLISINLFFYTKYTFSRFDFYNKVWSQEQAELISLDFYPSLFPLQFRKFLPALYDSNWAFHYAPNFIFLILAGGLFLLGCIYNKKELANFYKISSIFLVIILTLILSSGFITAH